MTESSTAPLDAARRRPDPFPRAGGRDKGYDMQTVDDFLARARAEFEGQEGTGGSIDAQEVRAAAFPLVRGGYTIAAVDAALGRVEDAFAARERERAVAAGGAEEWVGRARRDAQVLLDRLSRPPRERFRRAGVLRYGYHVDEVDEAADRLIRYFETGERIAVEQVRAVAFRMTLNGYAEEQVDAVLDAVIDVMLAVR